jgi:hypothetical protein
MLVRDLQKIFVQAVFNVLQERPDFIEGFVGEKLGEIGQEEKVLQVRHSTLLFFSFLIFFLGLGLSK